MVQLNVAQSSNLGSTVNDVDISGFFLAPQGYSVEEKSVESSQV